MQKHVGMNDCFAVCGVHSHGRGSPGRGIPVHHHTGGHRSPALVPGAQPNLPVGSTIVEKARQPHQSESQEACPSMLRLSKLKCKRARRANVLIVTNILLPCVCEGWHRFPFGWAGMWFSLWDPVYLTDSGLLAHVMSWLLIFEELRIASQKKKKKKPLLQYRRPRENTLMVLSNIELDSFGSV